MKSLYNPENLVFHAPDDADGGEFNFTFDDPDQAEEQSNEAEEGEGEDESVDFSEGGEGQAEEQLDVTSVIVNGEELQLTKEQLISLAQQGADYTRKTQQIAEERRELSKAKALLDFLSTDQTLGEHVAKRMWEASTGTAYTPEAVEAVQFQSQRAEVEFREKTLEIADTLINFRAAHPDVNDASMERIAMHMKTKGLKDPEVAFGDMMYRQSGIRERQETRPKISTGHGAPVRNTKKPDTMEEASAMALAMLRGERGQQNSY